MTKEETKCWLCDDTDIVNKSCTRCHHAYCAKDASLVAPMLYCNECMNDVEVEQTVFTRTNTYYSMSRDAILTKTSKCKDIIFKGVDLMFAVKKFCTLPDEELKALIYVYVGFVKQLQLELAVRDVNKARQESSVKIYNQNGRRVLVQQSTSVKVSKTTKIAKPTFTDEQLLDFAIKNGIGSSEELMAFIKKGK